ncbi:MAG: S-layer homology domain-containing protein, partial [Oscillospiraceae bacterium]|nr:S-layer homology domain-containing protein [Oscillospiraceae bacterium]
PQSRNLSGYTDAGEISDWAQDAMAWAVSRGLITGRTATTLVPQGTATRAEAATMLKRYMENAQ